MIEGGAVVIGQSAFLNHGLHLLRQVEQFDLVVHRFDAIDESLNRVAARIRFSNRFDNALEDLLRNADLIHEGFLEFYPELQQFVREQAIEL